MKLYLIVMFILLTGCQANSAKPEPEIVTVKVMVKEACIESTPIRPEFKTGTGPYPGDKAAAAILAEDFEMAEQYANAWEMAVVGCIKKKP
jgi:hypothetical protein